MTKIRTFVAIPIYGLSTLEKWMDYLKGLDLPGRIKWNDSGQWHLTLKFIGDVEETELDCLIISLQGHLADCFAGEVTFEGTGFFGSRDNPRVLWVGTRDSEWLKDLKEMVEQGVSVLDLPYDGRPFRPHLTIARIKSLKETSLLFEETDKKKNITWGVQTVKEVVLYRSRLTSDGPVYSVIERFGLKPE